MSRAILIMGPTASGKSALAMALCARIGGEVINADSMQVYRDLHVLTARPSAADEATVRHHLYGRVDAAERFSVGKWELQALAAIQDCWARGKVAIVAGGTGLYFRALTHGLSAIPETPEAISAALRVELDQLGAPALHARLAQVDPVTAARLAPHDGVRIARALGVFAASGHPLSRWQGGACASLHAGAWRGMTLWPDRATLYRRIDARFEAMVKGGALEEARALAARGLDPSLPAMRAHGMPWLAQVVSGTMDLETAISLSAQDTRHYAKRQFTWMRGQMADWPQLPVGEGGAEVEAALALV
jgi:tRNA dimethylallyltransferase